MRISVHHVHILVFCLIFYTNATPGPVEEKQATGNGANLDAMSCFTEQQPNMSLSACKNCMLKTENVFLEYVFLFRDSLSLMKKDFFQRIKVTTWTERSGIARGTPSTSVWIKV